MIMYSEYANAGHSQNGIIVSQWTPGKFIVDAKETVSLDVGFAGAKDKATIFDYQITSGMLPEGLALNRKTGIIAGSTDEIGTFTVTVQGIFDRWIKGSAEYTIVVGHGSIASRKLTTRRIARNLLDGTVVNLGVIEGQQPCRQRSDPGARTIWCQGRSVTKGTKAIKATRATRATRAIKVTRATRAMLVQLVLPVLPVLLEKMQNR